MDTLKAIWDALCLTPFYPRWAQALFLSTLVLVVVSLVVFSSFYAKAQAARGHESSVDGLNLTNDEQLAFGLILTDPLAGSRGAWAYPLHQELTDRGVSEAEATIVLNSLVSDGLIQAVQAPSYDELERRESTAPAYLVTKRGFSYAQKHPDVRSFQSKYYYTLRLVGSQQHNQPFLEQLRTLDGVEAQTRFIIESDPKMSRIAVFSYKPLEESLIRNLAKAFNVSVESFKQTH